VCGEAPIAARLCDWPRSVFALVIAVTLFIVLQFQISPALAQRDPSLRLPHKTPPSSFPKQPGGMFGPAPKIDRARPLYLQADQLIYDTKGNRVIAQGNVEIYYNDFILTQLRRGRGSGGRIHLGTRRRKRKRRASCPDLMEMEPRLPRFPRGSATNAAS
jgi:hypothetical protein